jgi:hypothetical protein
VQVSSVHLHAMANDYRPTSFFWNRFLPGYSGHCLDLPNYTLVTSIISVIFDYILLCLSVRLALYLQLPIMQKVLVLVLLSTGILTCIAGTFRVFYLDLDVYHTNDITWHAYTAYLATVIERDVGLLCASLPAYKTLFQRWINMHTREDLHSLELPKHGMILGKESSSDIQGNISLENHSKEHSI